MNKRYNKKRKSRLEYVNQEFHREFVAQFNFKDQPRKKFVNLELSIDSTTLPTLSQDKSILNPAQKS